MTVACEFREPKTGDKYGFRFERNSGGVWRIYVTHHPHNPYDTCVLRCHLYPDKKVCVDASKFCPRTLDQAKACALALHANAFEN